MRTTVYGSALFYSATQQFYVLLHLLINISYVFERNIIIVVAPTTTPNVSEHTSFGYKMADATPTGPPEVT
jgi:hypothetical protein